MGLLAWFYKKKDTRAKADMHHYSARNIEVALN